MQRSSAYAKRAVFLAGFHLTALGASLGILTGIGHSLGQIVGQGYWDLGFHRTIFLSLRDGATRLVWVGVLAALGGLGLRWLTCLLWPPSRRVLRLSFLSELARSRELRWRLSALILGLGWLFVTVMGYPGSRRRLATAVALCGAFLVLSIYASSLAARRVKDPDAPSFRALLAATYACGGLGLAGGYLQNRPYLHDLLNPHNVCGNLALGAILALVFWTIRSQVPRIVRLCQPTGGGFSIRQLISPALVPVALLAVTWGLTPVFSPPTQRLSNPQNVILIGIDTLRLDHTSLVDSGAVERDLTPNLRSLGEQGAVFRCAISQAPWTMPSFASVMTGKYPQEHGAISLVGELKERALTLAELLKEAGYHTAGIVAHQYVDAKHGFAQGFDSYNEENVVGHRGITSGRVTDLALDFLRTSPHRPFFLFLHYFDPHFEYEDHPDRAYADAYDGWLRGPQNHLKNLRAKRHVLSSQDLRFLRDLYEEEVANTDQQIGRLIAYLDESGLAEQAALVVLADHGEEFMERGWLGHTISLYDEVIKVPLVMRLPGLSPVPAIDHPVETRQVFATVLEYLGLRSPQDVRHDSLLAFLRAGGSSGAGDREPPVAYSSALLQNASLRSGKRTHLYAMQEERWKLIRDETRDLDFLFDLAQDPQERNNLAATEPQRLERMRERIQGWILRMRERSGKASRVEHSPEEIEQLKALGYL